MNKVWMWPQADINSDTVIEDARTLVEIEQFFTQLYHPYQVVYFSRARVALMAISVVEELSRPQLTFVQPFSSHCVLSAISHASTPTTIRPEDSKQQLVYHQWGRKTLAAPDKFSRVLIEDAVDSLITTNNSEELFPNNGDYCLFSLPKICGSSIGAIVVCRHQGARDKLIEQREQMTEQLTNVSNILNQPPLKEAALQAMPHLVPISASSIADQFNAASKTIKENLAHIKALFPKLSNLANCTNRLPSNLIVQLTDYEQEQLDTLTPFDIIEKQRTFYDYQHLTCHKVMLLPCHSQATWC